MVSIRVQRAAIGPDPTLARGARRAPRPPARRGNHRPVTIETDSLSPRSIRQVQLRARPTAALKARPVVVAKARFGVFAASPDPSARGTTETVRLVRARENFNRPIAVATDSQSLCATSVRTKLTRLFFFKK